MLILPVKNAGEAMSYIDTLRSEGLAVGGDFTWSYIPSEYDGWDDSTHTQPCVEIWFANESLESFYRLKWE